MRDYYSYAGYAGAVTIVTGAFVLVYLKMHDVIPIIKNIYIFSIIGIAFLVMSITEFYLQRAYCHRYAFSFDTTPLSDKDRYIIKSVFFRFIALLVPLLFFYAIVQNHYYFTQSTQFKPTRELFDILLIIFILFAIPYMYITLKFRGSYRYEINDYAILTIVGVKSLFQVLSARLFKSPVPKYRLYKNRRVKKVLLLYLVNFFFLTLMARFIVQEFHGFEEAWSNIFSDQFHILSWYQQYKTFFLLLFHLLFTIDVGIAVIGYSIASRWLFNRTKSVDATLSGWMIALICYPPFNTITTQFFGYNGLPTHNLFTNEYILALILAMVISFYLIFVWATVALGFKFSNLTNRGIIDRGPYAYIRHPAYVAKNSAWWIDNTFVLTNIWATVALAIWNLIYILRALTEERHLKRDDDYQRYIEKVKYKFIPKII